MNPLRQDVSFPKPAMATPLFAAELERLEAESRWLRPPARQAPAPLAARALRPDPSRNLSLVLPTLFRLLGAPGQGETLWPWLRPEQREPRRRVLLLCVDGNGFFSFEQGARFSALFPRWGLTLNSSFPSVTSTALSSLFQGGPPSAHGILGHQIWQETLGTLVDTLRMQTLPEGLPLAENLRLAWAQKPGILEAPLPRDWQAFHLMPAEIVRSGLSMSIYGRVPRVGYRLWEEGLEKTRQIFRQLDHGWVSLYTPTIDTLCHLLGHHAPTLGLALGQLEAGLAWLAQEFLRAGGGEPWIFVVADHGQMPIEEWITLTEEPWQTLVQESRVLGFSGRTMHVWLPPGDGASRVAAWRTSLESQESCLVLTREEAVEVAGSDPACPQEALGDFLVIPRAGCHWRHHPPEAAPFSSRLMAQHGGLLPCEMLIPALFFPASALCES